MPFTKEDVERLTEHVPVGWVRLFLVGGKSSFWGSGKAKGS